MSDTNTNTTPKVSTKSTKVKPEPTHTVALNLSNTLYKEWLDEAGIAPVSTWARGMVAAAVAAKLAPLRIR